MRLISVGAAAMIATSIALPLHAQDESLEPVVEAADAINQSARKSQLTIDSIADSTDERMQQYKQINKQIDGLRVYTKQLERQLQNQQVEKDELNRSIDEVSVVERQITPLMLRMIDGLEAFVELDVPFLEEERTERVASLQDLMDRSDVDVSEKFRRVMEAYQIEADYGRNIEAYTGEMTVDGQQQDVDFLRVGRVVLVYKTRDGNTMGVWNQTAGEWQPLSDSYRSSVTEALRIARKQLAPDLLMLPLFTDAITSAEVIPSQAATGE